jgi:murein DD-endopeptidase MepM/ murein hydrolase activator NlpD
LRALAESSLPVGVRLWWRGTPATAPAQAAVDRDAQQPVGEAFEIPQLGSELTVARKPRQATLELASIRIAPPEDMATLRALVARADRKPRAADHDAQAIFDWPVRGKLLGRFGTQPNGARSDGIDIVTSAGAMVVAAGHGTVVYAGAGITGYGRLVLIRHEGGFTTVYANNRELLVRAGAEVDRGQPIARVGSGAAPARLHFQLRARGRPVDPTRYLAPIETLVASVEFH